MSTDYTFTGNVYLDVFIGAFFGAAIGNLMFGGWAR